VNSGQLMTLDEFIADGTIDLSNVPEGLVAPGMVNGQTYAVSLGVNSQAIIIDTDAFEAAGIELPPTNWTWTQFEEIVMQLHEELGIWGFGSLLADEALWKSLYIGHGGWAFSEDNKSIGYEDDQPYIDYLNMILRLQEAGAIPLVEDEIELDALGPEGSPLVTGDSVMQYQWSNQVIAVTNAAGEGRNFQLWPLPRPEGGQSQNYLKPSMFFAIPAGSEHPEEAAKFISFFTNSMEANEILLAERGVPISSAVREHLQPLVDPVTQMTFDFLTLIESDSSPVPPPDPAGWPEIRDNVFDPLFIEPVRFGELSPEEGMQLLRDEANLILSQNE
jgi:multiple sugar transport system substrate-binding protein